MISEIADSHERTVKPVVVDEENEDVSFEGFNCSFDSPPILVFTRKYYNFWVIKMRTRLRCDGLVEIVMNETGSIDKKSSHVKDDSAMLSLI